MACVAVLLRGRAAILGHALYFNSLEWRDMQHEMARSQAGLNAKKL
jgi:hypothetical protein